MGGGERPTRRASFLGGILLVVAALACTAPILFIATSFYPPAGWGVLVVAAMFGVGAWLLCRDLGRTDKAMAKLEDTVLLDLDQIARYSPSPPPPRHSFSARWWRKVRGRATRIKEGAQR